MTEKSTSEIDMMQTFLDPTTFSKVWNYSQSTSNLCIWAKGLIFFLSTIIMSYKVYNVIDRGKLLCRLLLDCERSSGSEFEGQRPCSFTTDTCSWWEWGSSSEPRNLQFKSKASIWIIKEVWTCWELGSRMEQEITRCICIQWFQFLCWFQTMEFLFIIVSRNHSPNSSLIVLVERRD